ncbi:hypothetical protein E2C01_070924 [Portunus trituberculatus]|uniref:Uncharacterized protein n=1 Tax=Portunus trituberculatus TaxID=210409 RepID=A0A5B7I6M6_PORTR|nr:hypothetical protein [Portunus trituberculatus]
MARGSGVMDAGLLNSERHSDNHEERMCRPCCEWKSEAREGWR